jgi:phosphoribosylanthranilate isomerase
VIKALQVEDAGDVRAAERYHTAYHLLDARSQVAGKEHVRGGTGETFDWTLLEARRSKVPLVLSGGLGPGNVAEAIERVAPFAVDTASGTEASPGHKDPAKLQAFFAAVAACVPDAPGAPAPATGPAAEPASSAA